MPVLVDNLDESLIIQWQVSQENATDDDDKWMASINVIFDASGSIETKPDPNKRDYDLVIAMNSQNFNHDLNDTKKGKKKNYYARNEDGSLKTFDVIVNNKIYKFGVRYKFYINSDSKNDKVHVKYLGKLTLFQLQKYS
jgi:hypothetical protein